MIMCICKKSAGFFCNSVTDNYEKNFANSSIAGKQEEAFASHVIAVTNRHLCSRPLAEQVERVCRIHPRAVILREKDLPESDYLVLSRGIMEICESYQVPCVLHTYVNAARELDCPAIHLPLPLLREYSANLKHSKNMKDLKNFKIIGASIHSVDEALEAEQLGASYLTAGHIYATDCKKGLPPRGLTFLQAVCENVSLPVYAIGGIKLDEKQLTEVMDYGAKGGCIMSGMMTI